MQPGLTPRVSDTRQGATAVYREFGGSVSTLWVTAEICALVSVTVSVTACVPAVV